MPDINGANHQRREFAKRVAINTPVQGTSADLIKTAMVRIDDYLEKHTIDANMILQIHDELLFEVAAGDAEKLAEQVKAIMEKALTLDVPLVVDVHWGKSWAEIH